MEVDDESPSVSAFASAISARTRRLRLGREGIGPGIRATRKRHIRQPCRRASVPIQLRHAAETLHDVTLLQ